jgi:ABC-type branched-subunit amino acid transport system ATPase component
MASLPELDVQGGSFGYGATAAVEGIDLSVYAGRITALIGPNGAGKTATVLGLVGAVEPLAGRVDLHGRQRPVGLARAVGAGIGVVLDDRSVLTDLTVAEGLRLAGADQAAALATFPELGPLLHRRAGLLSGGEQQILTLARALAGEPSVLVVDELSHGLAPLVVERLFVALRAAADRGLAVFVVEQQVHAVLRYADQVVVVARGRTRYAGPASALDAALVRGLYLDAADLPPSVVNPTIPAPA